MRIFSSYKLISLLIILFFLCSCGPVECIDPDDWGGRLSTTIQAQDTNPVSQTTSSVTGAVTSEIINWTQSYELDGNRVVMIVKNSYPKTLGSLNCSDYTLFNQDNSWIPIFGKYLDFPDLSVCQFSSGNLPWCPADVTASNISTKNVPALNLPCKFNLGLGLYSTISTESNIPADVFSCNMQSAQNDNCFFHLGDVLKINTNGTSVSSPFFSGGCPTGGASFMPPPANNSKTRTIYFKFLDRVYSDNKGSYTVEFIQGVKKQDGGGIITKFVGLVQVLLCNVSQTMYQNIVKDTNFTSYIRILLILYIIFLGFSSVMGFTELTHRELLIRVLKIGLILQIAATDTSWTFFNTHLFSFFTNGIGEITGIIFGQGGDVAPVDVGGGASEQCNFQTLKGFEALDHIIEELFSYQTTRKIFSLLVWKAYGFFYIAIIFIALGVILFTLIKCVLIYLLSFLIISILISLAPIFIPFILFEKTRQFFSNWFSALTSYFIQPIIVLTFAFFLLQIFTSQLHSMLGYRVCWKTLIHIPILDIDIYAWQYDFSSTQQGCIMTPNSILSYESSGKYVPGKSGASAVKEMKPGEQLKFVGSLNVEECPGKHSCGTSGSSCKDSSRGLCDPYACSQVRYLGFPYLDQYFPPDSSRIEELTNPDEPVLVSFKDLVVFVMIIWFMHRFSKAVPSIAKQVSSGSVIGGVNLGGVAAGGMGGLRAGGRFLKFGGKIFGGIAMSGASLPYGLLTRGRSLSKDVGSVQKRIGRSLPVTAAKGIWQAGKDLRQGFRGYKEIHQEAMGRVIEDTAKGISKSKVGTAAKAFFAPHKLVGKGLEKVGQKTVGRAKAAVTTPIKQGGQIARKAIGLKWDQMLGRKHPELISGEAQKALDAADAAHASGNHAEAAKKYKEAADAGSTKAMMSLAHMHEHGEGGLEKDLSAASGLYDRAIEKGDQTAQAQLKRLEKIDAAAVQKGIDDEKRRREREKQLEKERTEREKQEKRERTEREKNEKKVRKELAKQEKARIKQEKRAAKEKGAKEKGAGEEIEPRRREERDEEE